MLGIDFYNGTPSDICNAISLRINAQKKTVCTPVNVDVYLTAVENRELMDFIKSSNFILADGTPLVWLSRLISCPLKRITGSDLAPLLCKAAAKSKMKVFILGGMEEVNQLAVKTISERYGAQCNGYSPPVGFEEKEAELEKIIQCINEFKPEILLVCMGAPKQEFWIRDNFFKTNALLALSAGAAVDFIAGTTPRAPKILQILGLEWFFRLAGSPRRLFKRYVLKDMLFIRVFLKEIIYNWRRIL